MAGILAEHFRSLDAIGSATEEQLVEVHEIGPKVAESIRAFFRHEGDLGRVEILRKAGVRMEEASRDDGLGRPRAQSSKQPSRR